MYRVMLVFDHCDLLEKIKGLSVWQEFPEFQISSVARDGNSAYRELQRNPCDIVFSEIRLMGMDGLQLLREVKRRRLSRYFVLCSETLELDYARQGIIYGASDYLVEPFEEKLFYPLFNRIIGETYEENTENEDFCDRLTALFSERNDQFIRYIDEILEKIYSRDIDFLTADKRIREIFGKAICRIFEENEWLDLYMRQEKFDTVGGIREADAESYRQYYAGVLRELYREYCELFPNVQDETLGRVIRYILENPESDLRQKTLAEQFHINTTFLSTVFSAHTGILFGDYVAAVRLKRAAFLLRDTELKVADIAERIGYRDVRYFSGLFKKRYGVTPSEFRQMSFVYTI